jgi:hypothetical protein
MCGGTVWWCDCIRMLALWSALSGDEAGAQAFVQEMREHGIYVPT